MTSMSHLTDEERNFARFFFLNFKVSPDIVRRFFDGVFPPTVLAQTINSNVCAIIKLHNKHRINAVQLEILKGVTGTIWPPSLPSTPVGTKATSSKDFDLTMMICLLRNLGGLSSPCNGWDQLPLPNDTSSGADLATLKWYRNQLAHTTVIAMDNNEFTEKWSQVEKALTSLNKSKRPPEVTEILNYDLDGEQAKILANAELRQLKKQYMDCEKEKEQIESDLAYYREGNLPKNIADVNATLVETWLKDDASFYETKGSELVYDKVKDCSCTLVTSNSGLGKTATIRHIALKFKREGFEIVPVESPKDIIKYRTKQKQVFLIDDVLGKYDLSPTLLDKWERMNEKLISCLETKFGSNKLLCTLRSQIALHKRFKNASTILNKEVINLERESNALSNEEKQKILIEHLKKNNLEKEIKTDEVEIICKTNYAFPLLCRLVSIDEERFRKRIAFFRQPLSLLRNEIDRISNENKKLYCILVICMLYNGLFSKSIFDIDSDEYDAKIHRIMQTCGLQRNMNKRELKDSAVSAVGSYLTKDIYNFRFIHDALEEITGCHFYAFDPRVMFSDCDIFFIRDRVRVHSNENMIENGDENIVIIGEDDLNDDSLTPLYTRLWTELTNGRFSCVLISHLFKNRNFVRIFGTHFEDNQSILGSTNTFLKIVSSERRESSDQSVFNKFLKILSNDELQDKKDAISRVIEAIPFRSTLMYWIVAFGCYDFFQYAWSKITTLDRNWILASDYIFLPPVKPFFPLAVLGGSLDIVKELICSGADVNCFSEFWETPLYIAVKSGRYDMVHLLVRNGAQVNLRGWFTMNIPIAVTSNKHELNSLILEYDLNQTEFHEAVRHNDLKHLRSNIRSENIDSKTKSGWTVLHYAVLLNNLEAVKVLFHEELPQNEDSNFDLTQVDQGEFVCRKRTPKVSIPDNNGLTAVHLAVITNNIDILSILLRNKAEVKVRDVFDRTPLHYITSESATKILLTHTSRNQRIETNRNAGEEIEYTKTPISSFGVMCFNITLKTSFRNVFRDCVNMPDREGNTPLHSVIKRRLLKEESSICIETLLEYGANPYLLNDSNTSALELIKSSCGKTSQDTHGLTTGIPRHVYLTCKTSRDNPGRTKGKTSQDYHGVTEGIPCHVYLTGKTSQDYHGVTEGILRHVYLTSRTSQDNHGVTEGLPRHVYLTGKTSQDSHGVTEGIPKHVYLTGRTSQDNHGFIKGIPRYVYLTGRTENDNHGFTKGIPRHVYLTGRTSQDNHGFIKGIPRYVYLTGRTENDNHGFTKGIPRHVYLTGKTSQDNHGFTKGKTSQDSQGFTKGIPRHVYLTGKTSQDSQGFTKESHGVTEGIPRHVNLTGRTSQDNHGFTEGIPRHVYLTGRTSQDNHGVTKGIPRHVYLIGRTSQDNHGFTKGIPRHVYLILIGRTSQDNHGFTKGIPSHVYLKL
ncbi:unnamed protein product [Mytilus coruscus]|uniref:Uncharacterized protein n=1 Tax=Mytilus coruscus TaxID=42192 RepID=A0A6J7ZXI2_MYTCO|nr:unnamed protein product [Mytilus coruscus]